MNKTNNKSIALFITKYWSCFLILLAFIGFISKSLYNYPVGIMPPMSFYCFIYTSPAQPFIENSQLYR